MNVRIPGSAANLGPGFDTLAVALCIYTEVSVVASETFSLETLGQGAEFGELPDEHLGVQVAREVLGTDKFKMRVSSDIPPSRGLGSSAALALGAAVAAGAKDPLEIATRYEGHLENVGASMFGGLITACASSRGPVIRRLPLDDDISFVVVVPEFQLSTRRAREVLPARVPLSDVQDNLGRMGVLIAGLGRHQDFDPVCVQDTIHQPYRQELYPESKELIDGLMELGALGATWSGAGPSIIAICQVDRAGQVARESESLVAGLGIRASILSLPADRCGLVQTDSQVTR